MPGCQSTHIPIVDDEPYICDIVSRWLKAEGYKELALALPIQNLPGF